MMKLGFLVGHCAYLPHATLLCDSIRKNTSLGETAQVVALVPEHLQLVVDIPGVTQVSLPVPEDFRGIPFADKMLAAATFEELCDGPYLWMDVDGFFLKTPVFPQGAEICLNPVDKRNIGDPYGSPRSALWQMVIQYFQIADTADALPPVTTTVSQETIYPYFNVGMVVVHKQRGLFRTVRAALTELLYRAEVRQLLQASPLAKVFFHQAVFTCAVLKLYGMSSISPLPSGVNYPLHLHDNHPRPVGFEDLISVRYDTYFEQNEVPSCWREFFPPNRQALKMAWYY